MAEPPPRRPHRTLVLALSYHGTAGAGWQVQPNATSIQGRVEAAMVPVQDGDPVRLRGASRTDAGVHARMQIAAAEVRNDVTPRQWVRALNGALPAGIAATWAAWGPDGWDPRRRCGAKHYRYRFLFGPAPSPLWADRAWWIPDRVETAGLTSLADGWRGKRDWRAAASAARPPGRSTVRELTVSSYGEAGGLGTYTAASRGFLMHQVRILAGTLGDHACSRLDAAGIAAALAAGDRTGLGRTAPPHGLTLERIELPGSGWAAPWPSPLPTPAPDPAAPPPL